MGHMGSAHGGGQRRVQGRQLRLPYCLPMVTAFLLATFIPKNLLTASLCLLLPTSLLASMLLSLPSPPYSHAGTASK